MKALVTGGGGFLGGGIIRQLIERGDTVRSFTRTAYPWLTELGVEQINGVSSISDGLRKRQGTRAVALLRETQLGDVFFHAIQRDASEQYLVAIGRTRLWVYDLEGNERAIVAPSGFGYLSKGTSSTADFRAASIADYTFISNTKVVPSMSSSWS